MLREVSNYRLPCRVKIQVTFLRQNSDAETIPITSIGPFQPKGSKGFSATISMPVCLLRGIEPDSLWVLKSWSDQLLKCVFGKALQLNSPMFKMLFTTHECFCSPNVPSLPPSVLWLVNLIGPESVYSKTDRISRLTIEEHPQPV